MATTNNGQLTTSGGEGADAVLGRFSPPQIILPDAAKTFFKYFKWTEWMSEHESYSLFIFSPANRLRRLCMMVADHRYFDYIILFFISLNCVTLAIERPRIPPWSLEREILNVLNNVFTFVFALEMTIKVIAKGLWYGDDAYLKCGWNIMDFALVGISLFDLLLSVVAQKSPRIFGILRVFRLLRSLRPLRFASLFDTSAFCLTLYNFVNCVINPLLSVCPIIQGN